MQRLSQAILADHKQWTNLRLISYNSCLSVLSSNRCSIRLVSELTSWHDVQTSESTPTNLHDNSLEIFCANLKRPHGSPNSHSQQISAVPHGPTRERPLVPEDGELSQTHPPAYTDVNSQKEYQDYCKYDVRPAALDQHYFSPENDDVHEDVYWVTPGERFCRFNQGTETTPQMCQYTVRALRQTGLGRILIPCRPRSTHMPA